MNALRSSDEKKGNLCGGPGIQEGNQSTMAPQQHSHLSSQAETIPTLTPLAP